MCRLEDHIPVHLEGRLDRHSGAVHHAGDVVAVDFDVQHTVADLALGADDLLQRRDRQVAHAAVMPGVVITARSPMWRRIRRSMIETDQRCAAGGN